MVRRTGESGNIFFTLFGAVAMVGLIGVATSALLRGPVGTVVAINQKSKADSQIQIASRLALLEAAQDPTDDGDCDADGFIEPLPWRTATGEGPTNGGWLPMSIGAAKIDPWGTDYGYCVWDNGALNQNGHANCDNVDGAGSNSRRLDGGNRTDYPVMVIISAGPDRDFQVECNDWVDADFDGAPDNDNPGTAGAIVYNPQPNDDIIISYTYDEAIGASQGLWQLQSGDPGILETDKGIDVGGNANFQSTAQFGGNTSFGGAADFSGGAFFDPGSKLDLSSGGLLSLPTEASLSTCNGANEGLLRINTHSGTLQVVEICENNLWAEVGANATTAVHNIDDLDDAQKSGANLFMGTDDASMAYSSAGAAAANTGIGVNALDALTTGSNNIALGAGTGATITTEDNNILIGQGVDIPAPGTSDYLNIGGIFYTSNSGADVNIAGNTYVTGALDATGNGTIGGTLGVTGATTLSNTLGVTGATTLGSTLTVAGDINDSNGDVVINDGLTVTGAGDFQSTLNVNGNISNDSGDVTIGDNLHVTGTSDFDGNINVDADISNVGGDVSINDGLSITGDISDPGGDVVINDTLNVTGVATFDTKIGIGDAFVGGTAAGTACATDGELHYDAENDYMMMCTGGAWEIIGTTGGGGAGVGAGGFWKEVAAEDGRIYYSSNFVGVGENNPQERLHVSNGGLMVAGTHGGVATVPVTGAGTRMFFHDNKSSFRAGAVTGTQWDTANVGDYSFGAGYDVTASGTSSIALGQEANAAAANSMAIGLGDPAGVSPQVSGVQSLGIFMGAHPGVNMSAANTTGLFGGELVIDPNVPATKLSADGTLAVDIEGDIGAIQYCDENGNNCFLASDVSSGVLTAPGNNREILFNSGGIIGSDLAFVYTSTGKFGVGTAAPEAFIDFSSTGAMLLPRGDTAQRPAGVNGMLRYNSANDRFEGYQGGGWQDVLTDAAIAAGNQGEIQFNSGGAMGASNAFFWDLAKSGLALGSSTVTGTLTLDVTGDVGAQQYCDDNGANCFLASDVASGTITAPGADTQIIFNSGGELGAHANFTFNDATNVLAVTGTLNLTSAATLGDTLSVTGATTLSSTLDVTGATSLSGTLNVDGDISDSNSDVTINDGLNVTGAADFDSTLNVDSNVTVPTGGVAIGSATLSTGGEQDLELDVTGDIGGTNYCDDAGNNCFTAADIASGATGAPGNNREMIFNNNGLLGTNANFVFGSAGQLGIGTNNPNDELDVVGTAQITGNTVLGGTLNLTSAANLGDTLDVTGISTFNDTVQFASGSAAAPAMTFTVDPNTGFYMPTADQLGVSINGAERIRITSNGAIVIGGTTASSGEQTLELDINGDIGGANYCDENGSNCFQAADLNSGNLGAPGLNREILFNSNGLLGSDANFVFGSAGDLGIGTNNPQAFVDFNSTEAILMPRGLTGQRPGGINGMFRYNTTKDRFEGYQGGNWRDVLTDAAISAGNDRQIQFNSGGEMGADANFVFDSAGRLGIGTGTPGQTLDVAGTVNATGAVTFGDTLSLTSAATLGDVLSVTGATTLSSTLDVTGATTLSSTLGVTGVATFSEDVRLKDGLATDPSLTFTNDQNTGVFSAAADELGFTVGGAEAFRVDSSGNLLVGTTSVSGTLLADVEGDLGAVQYCDENGNNCFTAASVSSGSAPAPGNNREIVYNSNGVLSADPNLVFGSGGELGIGVAVPDDELDVAGTAQITGNTVIGGTLDVAGATQIDDSFSVINGNATTLSGTLGVTGAATLSDTLSVTSAGTFGNTLSVTGATTLSSTLNVTGATSLSSTLNVDGDISDSNSDVTINDGLSVTGNVTVPTSGVAIGSATLSTGGEQDLELDVTGDIGGTNYCDDAGNNCFTAADVASGALGAPGNDTEIIFNSGNQLWTNANFVLDSAGRLGIGLANPDDKLDVVGTAQITGNTVIGGTLDVAGATQIDNTFDVINGNATTLSGTLGVTGATTLSDTLALTSAATFGYTLSIAGEISDPDSDLQINDGLNVTGNVTVPTSGIAIGSATLSTGGEQDLELDVTGDIGGTNYCDADGNNCFTATDVASGALGAPGLNREMIFNSGGKLWTDTNLVFGSSGWLGLGIAVPQAELDIAGTGAVLVPRGTTAQQPASPVNGMFRYNSDKDRFEGRQGGAWRDVLTDGAISAGAQGEIQFNSGGEMGASNKFFWDLAKSGLALGSSTVSGTLTLDVTGDVGAQQYCDDTGANCFLASDVFAGTITAPGVDTQIIFNSGGEMGSHANFTFNDATNVLTLVGNASIDGTLSDPNSSLQINDDLNVTGAADFDSTLNVDSNVTVPTGGIAIGSATLSTGGEQNLELDVTGDVGAQNYCDDIGNDCFTAADFASLASGSVPAPGSNRQITFNSNGSFWASTNFVFGSAGQLGIGLANPDDELDVVGTAQITGNTVLGGTLNLTSAANFGDILAVTGATTLSSTLDVSGVTQIDNNFNVLNGYATSLSGTLGVTGAATFGNTVYLSAGSAAVPSMTFTGDGNTGMYHPAADELGISTGGTEKIRITAAGALVIGDTSASTGGEQDLEFDVAGDIGGINYCDENGNNCFTAGDVASGALGAPGLNRELLFNNAGVIGTNPNFVFGSAGQLGIGLNNPNDELDVVGTAQITGNTVLGGTLNLTSAATFGYTLDVTGATTLSSTLNVTGATSLSSTLNVDGDISDSNSDVTINDGLSVTGNVTVPTSGIAIGSATLSTGGEQDLELDVTGDIGGTNYCDADGNNCFTAGDVASGVIGAPGLNREMIFNSGGKLWTDTNFVFGSSGWLGLGIAAPQAELDIAGTGSVLMPRGTTAQRPAGINGMFRYNADDNRFEGYQGGNWRQVLTNAAIAAGAQGQVQFASGGEMGASANFFWDTAKDGLALGSSTVTGTLKLDVTGDVGATNYCDDLGGDCFTAGDIASLAAGSVPAPGNNRQIVFNSNGGFWADANFVFGSAGQLGIGLTNPDDALDVVGTAQITGNTVIGGTLGVTGATTLSDTLTVTSAGTFGDTLGVTGATTLSGTLDVSGITQIDNNLNVLNGYATNLSGTLGVTGASSFASTVYLSAGSAAVPAMTFSSDGDTGLYNPAANELGIALNGTERIRITNSGAFVIGDTVNSSGVQTLEMDINGDIGAQNYCDADGNNCFTTADITNGVINAPGLNREMIFNSGGKLWTDTNLVFGSAGQLGIGLANPNDELDVVGTAQITGNTAIGGTLGVTGAASLSNTLTVSGATTFDGLAYLSGGSGAAPSLSFTGDTNTGLFRAAADEIGFAVAGSEAVRLDSAGNLLVGTTAVSGALLADIEGNLGAAQYCDENGNNCFSATSVSGGDGGKWENAVAAGDIRYMSGDVGIGVLDPNVNLDVDGTIQIAYDGEACDAAREGAVQFSSGTNTFYFCADDLNGWESITLGSGTLAALGDTNISGPATGQVLYYSGTEWVNANLPADNIESVLIAGNNANTQSLLNLSGLAIGSATLSTGGTQDLELDVTGDIGATFYCDENGNNCFTAGAIAGGTASHGSDGNIQFASGGIMWSNDNFVFTSTGRHGVGTSAPISVMDVFSDTDDVYFTASDITVSQEKRNPPALVLRGKYDSGPGGSITADNYDVTLENFVDTNNGGNTIGRFYVNMNGTEALSIYASNNSVGIGTGVTTPTVPFQVAGTSAIQIPAGTTGQQPGGAAGMLRFNTTLGRFEGYNGSIWGNLAGDLTDLDNVTVTGPVDGNVLYYSGTGWVNAALPSSAINAAGADRQIQFNSGNAFAADANFVYTAGGDFIVGSYQFNDTTTGNEDGRMFFDQSKGAFRAGETTGTQWDGANIGDQSIAMGLDTIASGVRSTAFGTQTTASGTWSTAMGRSTTASGNYSTAMGRSTVASGTWSTAMGAYTSAGGLASMAIGLSSADPAIDPVVTGQQSLGIFMGDQSGYDLASANTMALVGIADLVLDADGSTPASKGCLRFNDTTDKLEFSHDCSSYAELGGAPSAAGADRQIQFNSGNAFAADANFVYTSMGYFGVGNSAPTTLLDIGVDSEMRMRLTNGVELTDSYNMGLNTTSNDTRRFFLSTEQGTYHYAFGFGDANPPENDNILGVSGSLDSGSSWNPFFVIGSDGQVGVGTNDPNTQLDVDGTVQIAYDGEACDAAREGAIQFTSGSNTFYFCADDLNGWEAISLGAGTLAALSDTTIAAPAQGEVLYYSGTKWVNNALAINDLTDAAVNYTSSNMFLGQGSGAAITTGQLNTALGKETLAANTTGGLNTAIGDRVLFNNTTGLRNIATGYRALYGNTTGSDNVANGFQSLFNNTTGSNNTAVGNRASMEGTTGDENAVYGYGALYNNTIGRQNTAIGTYAGGNSIAANGDMDGNSLFGYQAGYNLEGGAAGLGANYNILMGYRAGDLITTGDYNVIIGNNIDPPFATASNYINLGGIFYGSMNTGELFIGGNGALAMPVGTDGQRPGTLAGTTAVNGMLRYNTTSGKFEGYQGGSWQDIITGAASSSFTGLTDTPSVYTASAGAFVRVNSGETGLEFQTAGLNDLIDAAVNYTSNNMFVGQGSGGAITSGVANLALGKNTLTANTSGTNNVALGYMALNSNTTAGSNVAIGYSALSSSNGAGNIAIGYRPLVKNTSGMNNIGMGYEVLGNNTTGSYNTAVGIRAAANAAATDGDMDGNSLFGYQAGYNLEGGASGAGANYNLLMGYQAGDLITTGDFNIIIGTNIDPPFATASNYINLGDIFYGSMNTGELFIGGNGALAMPVGTDGQRPGTLAGTTAVNGMLRYNTTSGKFEGYQGGSWQDIITAGGSAATPDRGIQFNSGNAFAAVDTFLYTSAGDFIVGSTQTGDTGNAAHDRRMFFDKSKGAFRAGEATGTAWDDANIGNYSIALGRNTTASAQGSIAIGVGATAGTNDGSIAMGNFANSTGLNSIAIGDGADAQGFDAVALGYGTAVGDYSMSIGYATSTNANYSTALGVETYSDAQYSLTMGNRVRTTGDHSAALGLGFATGANANWPKVSGANSYGIFMGDQATVDFASANTMGLFGGRMVIDPSVPATKLVAQTGLDVDAAIRIAYEGEVCSGNASMEGAIRFDSGANTFAFCANNATGWENISLGAGTLAALSDTNISGPATGQVLYYSGTEWVNTTLTAASIASAGSDRQIQFNSGNAFAADANFVYTSTGDFIVGSYQTADTGNAAEDRRMFFDKSKGAFRAGSATLTQWDDANVGNYSVAMGLGSIASATSSFAVGNFADASGDFSVAMGDSATASNINSVAIGSATTASGLNSVALGYNVDATGQESLATGNGTTASGLNSTAIGRLTTASGAYSTAMGYAAVAGNGTAGNGLGDGSFALGLIDDAVGITTPPKVTGIQSFGIFMGDQDGGVDLASSNTMGLFGGRMVIDPSVPATNLVAQTGLDVDAAIRIAYESEVCSGNANMEGAIRFDSGSNTFAFCANNATGWENISLGAGTLAALSDTNISGPATGDVLYYSGTQWVNASTIPATSLGAAGSNRQIQFNSGGKLTAVSNFYLTAANQLVIGTSGINKNMYIGAGAGNTNNGGANNIFIGNDAGNAHVSGNANVFLGNQAGQKNQTGAVNTFLGANAGKENISGGYNVAIGYQAGQNATTASENVSIGAGTGLSNNGTRNTMLGHNAGVLGTALNDSVFLGYQAGYNATGNQNTFIGSYAGDLTTAGTNNILIGYNIDAPMATTSNYINIGDIFYGSGGTGELFIGGNGALTVPVGDNSTRPGDLAGTTAVNGMLRYNSATDKFEGYQGGIWTDIITAGGSAAAPDRGIQFNSGNSFTADANFVYTSTGDLVVGSTQTAGTGSRMFFDDSKGAFRAGRTAGTEWDDANVALYSIAMGDSTTANGFAAVAMGANTTATGSQSMAMGSATTASNSYSVAMGESTVASGFASMALGRKATASANYSMAVGLGAAGGANPQVSGNSSFGIFMGDQAGYDLSSANTMALVGIADLVLDADGSTPASKGCLRFNDTSDKLEFSHDCSSYTELGGTPNAAGSDRQIQFNSGNSFTADANFLYNAAGDLIVGSTQKADTGNAAHDKRMFFDKAKGAFRAGGVDSTQWDSIGDYSIALGRNAQATNWGSIAIGDDVTATGPANSVAIGVGAASGGTGSVALGGSTANGVFSTAMGGSTTASGSYATAIGRKATASGFHSMAVGLGNATGAAPVVSGASSMGIFMGDQNGVDLASSQVFGLFGGEIMIDYSSATAGRGCLRYDEGTSKLQFSHDCTAYSELGGAGNPAGSDRQIQFNSGNAFAADANFVYTNTGLLGIGTASPTETLEVSGTAKFVSGAPAAAVPLWATKKYSTTQADILVLENVDTSGFGDDGDSADILFKLEDGSSTAQVDAGRMGFAWGSAANKEGYFRIEVGNNGVLTEALRLTSAGNLGIGTNAPTEMLEVTGTAKANKIRLAMVTGAANPVVGNTAAGAVGEIQFNSGGALASNGSFKWDVSTSILGIGTATPDDGKVEVKGGTVCVDTDNDGFATSCISSESDIRLKKNVQPITGALDKIHQLTGVSYDWRWDEFNHIKRYEAKPHAIGVIAQDVEKVFPEAMGEDIDGYKTVEYRYLVAPMVEAIKELDDKQNAQVAALRAENEQLKAQLASLETDRDEMHAMMNEVMQDVKGLKAHTGYGVSKAEIGLWFIAGMGSMALLVFFTNGYIGRRRKYPEAE